VADHSCHGRRVSSCSALNLTSQVNATVPVVVSKFANDYEVLHSQMAAASILATLPALVLMFFWSALHCSRPDARLGQMNAGAEARQARSVTFGYDPAA